MKIVVLGAGAWGTALAMGAARQTGGHAVTLWARDGQQVADMLARRQNARYLPGVDFPAALAVSGADPLVLARAADLVIVATPMAALRSMLLALRGCTAPVAWLCKGFEAVAPADSGSFGLLAADGTGGGQPARRGA